MMTTAIMKSEVRVKQGINVDQIELQRTWSNGRVAVANRLAAKKTADGSGAK
jgi:hypothetical protein